MPSTDSVDLFARGTQDLNSPYNYDPTRYVTIIMVVLFSITTSKRRYSWQREINLIIPVQFFIPAKLCTSACGGCFRQHVFVVSQKSLVGLRDYDLAFLHTSTRLSRFSKSNVKHVYRVLPSHRISTTIIAPTPLVAANFIILGRLISRLGPQYSRLSPKWYTIIFCACDIIALVIQGIGGGLAASAETSEDANKGSHIMLGGIAFQLAVIVIYALLATEFFLRYLHDRRVRTVATHYTDTGKPIEVRGQMTRRLQLMSGALLFSTLFLFIRAVYRTIELQDGWNGRIISTEVYFNVLDGAMVILSMYIVNFLHPGYLLSNGPTSDSSSDSTAPIQMSSL